MHADTYTHTSMHRVQQACTCAIFACMHKVGKVQVCPHAHAHTHKHTDRFTRMLAHTNTLTDCGEARGAHCVQDQDRAADRAGDCRG
jgi:hypothetical protein